LELVVADYLSAHPNGLDGVWVGWDDAALGAVQAVDEAGSKAVVTGSDAVAEAVAAIESGKMLATSLQPWQDVLKQVLADVDTYQKDKSLPKKNFVEVASTLVDKSNAATITPSDKLG
ncbi:MAG: substrate-binding domain-containing protein, partial [Microbacterium sp.]|nr:substrate-binding domain-containing protein [Microbacterium sp.]